MREQTEDVSVKDKVVESLLVGPKRECSRCAGVLGPGSRFPGGRQGRSQASGPMLVCFLEPSSPGQTGNSGTLA